MIIIVFDSAADVGRHFVERRYQQRVGDHACAGRNRALQPRHHLIEIVEGAECVQAHAAAFGRTRIDVVEVLEAGRVFELAEQRQAVPPVPLLAGSLSARTGEKPQSIEDGQ